jgi:hypothetical protein
MYRKILISALTGCLVCGTALAQTTGNSFPREPGYQHYLARLAAFDQKFSRLDTDHNGYLDSNEATADPALARDFHTIAHQNRVTPGAYKRWLKRQSTTASKAHAAGTASVAAGHSRPGTGNPPQP